MGIHGLLQFLKPFVRKATIEDFKGKTVGVDAMCWMHKGAFACSRELVLGEDTDKFVFFFVKMCQILLSNSIKPVIVFDGARLPAKAKEEADRNDKRTQNRDEALDLIRKRERGESVDDNLIDAKCQGAIKITHAMISRLMTALEELKIRFCVAPYEADAQLAYMCRKGWVHAVISEDSDLLAYGCPNTIFKMDRFGNCDNIALPCLQTNAAPPALTDCESDSELEPEEEFDRSAEVVAEGEEAPTESKNGKSVGRGRRGRGLRGRGRGRGRGSKATDGDQEDVDGDGSKDAAQGKRLLNFKGWTAEKFTEFCVLCGTDYREFDIKIKQFGIKRSHELFRRFKNGERMLKWMRRDKRWQDRFPCAIEEYMQRFFNVLAVFFHHIAFDPLLGKCVSVVEAFPLRDRIIPGVNLDELCGKGPAAESARLVWEGKLDARTLGPRSQEPLTAAERRMLDTVMRKTNEDQRAEQLQRKLRADAAEMQAAREAKQVEQSAAVDRSVPQPTLQEGKSDNALEAEEEEEDTGPKEMKFLPGDINAIMSALREQDKVDSTQTSPAEKVPASAAEPPRNPFARKVGVRPAAPVNPFAKRVGLSPEIPGRANTATQDLERGAKRPRHLGSRLDTQSLTSQDFPPKLNERPIATPSNHSDTRRVASTTLGPRGGNAASDAVSMVLAQRGMPVLEAVAPTDDRSKLTGFFKQHHRVTEVAPPPKRKTLENWRARPWEEENKEQESSDKLSSNPLSSRHGGGVFNKMTRGW